MGSFPAMPAKGRMVLSREWPGLTRVSIAAQRDPSPPAGEPILRACVVILNLKYL